MLVSKSIKKRSRTKTSSAKTNITGTKSRKSKVQSRRNGDSEPTIQYVLPLGNGWVVKNSKLKKFTFFTDSKREAVHWARSIAKRRGERLEVYTRDGKVLKERY